MPLVAVEAFRMTRRGRLGPAVDVMVVVVVVVAGAGGGGVSVWLL